MARNPDAVGKDLRPRPEAVRELVATSLVGLTGAADLVAAMGTLFKPQDVVGIKVNCLAAPALSSRPELVNVLVEALEAAGISRGRIVIWDRSDRELRLGGFKLARSGEGPLCYGTNSDYEPRPTTLGSVGTCMSRILTETITALIDVPVLKDHDLAGVSGHLKSAYGAIHNPNKYHDGNCDPYVAEVNTHPALRDKLRLVLTDGLVAQCHGGPAYKPDHAWPWAGLVASRDPVAVDRIAWRVLEERRRERGLPTLVEAQREPRWIATAQTLGLGVADPGRIEEVKL